MWKFEDRSTDRCQFAFSTSTISVPGRLASAAVVRYRQQSQGKMVGTAYTVRYVPVGAVKGRWATISTRSNRRRDS